MNLFRINFDELYRRHLCRHADFGINVLHLIAVLGIDFAIAGLIDAPLRPFLAMPARFVILLTLSLPWMVLLFVNVSAQAALLSALVAIAIIAAAVAQTLIPWWCLLLLIPALHQFQQWGHRLYPRHDEMSEFKQRYPKGAMLFVLLTIYELPILAEFFLRATADPRHPQHSSAMAATPHRDAKSLSQRSGVPAGSQEPAA